MAQYRSCCALAACFDSATRWGSRTTGTSHVPSRPSRWHRPLYRWCIRGSCTTDVLQVRLCLRPSVSGLYHCLPYAPCSPEQHLNNLVLCRYLINTIAKAGYTVIQTPYPFTFAHEELAMDLLKVCPTLKKQPCIHTSDVHHMPRPIARNRRARCDLRHCMCSRTCLVSKT